MVMHLSFASGKTGGYQNSRADGKWTGTIDYRVASSEPDSQINGFYYSKIRQR